ncbi:MAG: DNA-directed RNA polymerase subunit omega [Oscillospiraceae bacterium]
MHKPAMYDIIKKGESYYSLVVAVAKRARKIASNAEENGQILIEKPVQMAAEQFANGKYHFEEKPDLGKDVE